MRIIPVLDLLNSVVVRGVAGQRDAYRPVESVLTSSSKPLDVAAAISSTFGCRDFYVADLDAIVNDTANLDIYGELRAAGFRLMVDAGLKSAADADIALTAGADQVIVGLETWPTLASLELLMNRLGPEQVVFSLDLRAGKAMRTLRDLTSDDPLDIAAAVLEAGVRELIVLDLAAVGVGEGTPTLALCRRIREFAPKVRLITGGGIRDIDDLKTLSGEGLDGVLIASALHNGRLKRDELCAISESTRR